MPPLVLFLTTWTRPYVALLCLAALVVAARFFSKSFLVENNCDEALTIEMAALAAIAALAVGLIAGWLGTAPQSSDWDKHNAVLHDLIDRPWPVYYTSADGSPTMLSYYIGMYLLPAAVGKLLRSFVLAYVVQYFWLSVGLFLVIAGVLLFARPCSGRCGVAVVVAFLLFNCCLFLSQGLSQVSLRRRAASDSYIVVPCCVSL